MSEEIVSFLQEIPLFADLPEEELERLAEAGEIQRFHRGEVIVKEGDLPEAFYIIRRGSVVVRRSIPGRPEQIVAYFHEKDYFGEMAFLRETTRNATVEAISPLEVFSLDKDAFRGLLYRHPELQDLLEAQMEQRLTLGETRFPWLGDDEVVLSFRRKHLIALLRQSWWWIIPLFLGSAAAAVAQQTGELPYIILSSSLFALAALTFLYLYLDWRNDYYVVTNRRIVHLERVLLVREDRDEAPIQRVQDVNIVRKGPLAKVFDFGDMVIQTAGTTGQIVFRDLPSPDEVLEVVLADVERSRRRSRVETKKIFREELQERLGWKPRGEALEGEEAAEGGAQEGEEGEEEKEPEKKPFDFLLPLRVIGYWLKSTFYVPMWEREDDTITWRTHWFVLVRKSMAPFFNLLFFTGLLWLIGMGWGPMETLSPSLRRMAWVLIIPVDLFILGWWFYRFWDWKNDLYIITSDRIIDLKKRPLFLQEERRETTLDKIQNVNLTIPSPIAQLFNYGTIEIETAGEVGAFEFKNVYDPRRVQQEIFAHMDELQQRQRESEERRRLRQFADWFAIYDELKREQQQMGVELEEGETS
ncbi:MAG: hypothetical protein D6759_02000 [Chloroflexi bacterium]|nr:MAG: hypothetical protein D6759_02000 [Chloroflexota bacterium]